MNLMKRLFSILVALCGIGHFSPLLFGGNFNVLSDFGPYTNCLRGGSSSTLVQGGNGLLYGVTSFDNFVRNSYGVAGAIFSVSTAGTGFHLFPQFTNGGPQVVGDITLSGNVIYGTAYTGLTNLTVFSVQTNGTAYTTLHTFAPATEGSGVSAHAPLLVTNNVIYGTLSAGGTGTNGTVYRINTDGSGFAVIHTFSETVLDPFSYTNADGATPECGLVLSGDWLLGSASLGGTNGGGTLYQMHTDGSDFSAFYGAGPSGRMVLYGNTVFSHGYNYSGSQTVTISVGVDSNGYIPSTYKISSTDAVLGSFLIAGGGIYYGTPENLGNFAAGSVKSFSTNLTATATTLHAFSASPSGRGLSGIIYNSDGLGPGNMVLSGATLYGSTQFGTSSGFGSLYHVQTNGTSFANIFQFKSTGGIAPTGLILQSNVYYGVTAQGGAYDSGMIFRVSPDGTGLTDLYDFSANYAYFSQYTNRDGAIPIENLAVSGNTLYGATSWGGTNGNGTLYKINTDGTGFFVLYQFQYAPAGGVTLSSNTLYVPAGALVGSEWSGAVFAIGTDGSNPQFYPTDLEQYPTGKLLIADNVIYGTLLGGKIFKMNTDGTGYSDIHTFASQVEYPTANSGGCTPAGNLVITNGTLYGVATAGGPSGLGTLFKMNTNGSQYTVLHSFSPADLGQGSPYLVLNGTTLYGTTCAGDYFQMASGSIDFGEIFKIQTDGSNFQAIRSFNGLDGAGPILGLLNGSNLIGVTQAGGQTDAGEIFTMNIQPALTITPQANAVVLAWSDPTFTLQAAPAASGPFTGIPGATSPYTNVISGPAQFFRLKSN